MFKCPTGKRVYLTEAIAEDALLDAHSRHHYAGTGPVAIYQCEACSYFHFTSKGKMNETLARQITNGKIRREQEANRWLDKLKK